MEAKQGAADCTEEVSEKSDAVTCTLNTGTSRQQTLMQQATLSTAVQDMYELCEHWLVQAGGAHLKGARAS